MKPLLAYGKNVQITDVQLPTLASEKLDGIRCCMVNGVAMSRNEKPIPNEFVQRELRGLHGLDGELILVDRSKDFNDQQSAFMSQHGKPDFVYMVFDYWDSNKRFMERLKQAEAIEHPRVQLIEQYIVHTYKALRELYNKMVAKGAEGLICRHPRGIYKHGRSTLSQQLSLKLKPVKTAEAIVVNMEPLVDQSGVVHDMLGKFIVNMGDVEFAIGTGEGLTRERREHFWEHADKYIGKTVTFQYQELSKFGVPRFPSWRGFRHE